LVMRQSRRFPGRVRGVFESWSVCAAACLVVVGCAVNPVTMERELVLMSEAQEIQMGLEAYPVYTQMSGGLFQDRKLQAYVQSVGERLARVSHRPGLEYRFNVVDNSDINAYALPGGKISITRGLLAKMENEAQLASVLGHEIGHVTARHAAAGYTRQVIAGVLTTIGVAALETANVAGSDILAQGGMVAANLVLTKYSRDQERQADSLGMDYMTKAGYSPAGMVQTMEILMAAHDREPSAVESMFMTHPLTSERVVTAERLASRQDRVLMTEDRLRAASFLDATGYLREVAPAYEKMDQAEEALSEGKTGEALRFAEEATLLGPREAQIWSVRASAEAKAGRLGAALASAEKAVALYPDLYQARLAAGVLNFELKRYGESLSHLEVANGLVPGQPPVSFFAGRNFEATGKREDAARAYASVLDKVQRGEMAEYCYRRLVEWGYIKTAPAGRQG